MLALRVVLFFQLLSAPPLAWSWGDKGHRITGEIARQELTTSARAKLKQLMGSDDLASISLFMDQNKAALEEKIPGSRDWHYDDRPICQKGPTPVALSSFCPGGNCASVQIRRHIRILTDPHATRAAQVFAVRVLVHVLGDIHQPLHASDDDDRGGNQMKVKVSWRSQTLNLHSVWDTTILQRMYENKSVAEVAAELRKQYADRAVEWRKGTHYTWLEESHQLAKDKVYTQEVGFQCGPADEKTVHDIPDSYVKAAEPVIAEQLAKAGFRIARILNRALD